MNTLRLALFTDSAPQWLEQALTAEFASRGVTVQLQTWAFTSPLAVQDALHRFAPDSILYWACSEAEQFPSLEPLLALPYTFVVFNMATRDDGTCGNYALRYAPSVRARILQWNAHLVTLAQTSSSLSVIDLDLIQSRLGRRTTFDARLWAAASMALTPVAVKCLAKHTADHLCARLGRLHKVLVTDLDGTLWDGIVSEIGPDAIAPMGHGRAAYRAWLRALAERGILLAVASRNDLAVATAAFERPELGMKVDDFIAFEADWGPKSEMLKRIATRLHVGLDALVFIDDREEVRGEVRAALPEVTVPEMPTDPSRWVEFLSELNLFETVQVTEEDALRADSLRAEGKRSVAAQALSPEAYLASLQQVLTPEPLGPHNLARAAQLTQRCNQFNMRNTRYTEAELVGRVGWVYRLKDKFGDLGMISAVVLDGNFIDTWVISCRALNRGVEALILDHLKSLLPVTGAYVPSERNGRCAEIYATYGVPHA